MPSWHNRQALRVFPDLPVDIARRILETAAIYSKKDACRLVLVSKVVRSWIDPILYHTVVIHSTIKARRFAVAIRLRNDPSFFRRHIKRLVVYHESDMDKADLHSLIGVATDVVSLAWWSTIDTLLPYVDKLLRVRYFSLLIELEASTVHTVLPPNVTHLNVIFDDVDEAAYINPLPPYSPVWIEIFKRCPHLTHIAVDFYPSTPPPWKRDKYYFVHSALSVAPPTLKAFIILFQGPLTLPLEWDASELGSYSKDPRFITVSPDPCYGEVEGVFCYPERRDPMMDWWDVDCTPSLRHWRDPDVWQFADMYLRARAEKAQRMLNGDYESDDSDEY
ncbi:hypothetical protein BDZ89DRAFT_1159479 [Hymenopellis radicata]|nr:hypothetical protein BDZ89DRAFT_1159479 [Hymenopellis radicata]